MHLDTTARRTAQGQELLSVARTELGFLRDVLALWYVRLLLMMYCRRGALHCSVSGGRRPDCVWGQVHQIRPFDCMLASHTAVDVVWCLRTHTVL